MAGDDLTGTSAQPPVTTARYDVVTVFFEAEVDLLRLQARSMKRWADRELIGDIVVIDNGRPSARVARQLPGLYGDLAPKVTILAASDVARVPATAGWRSQQVFKLEIARRLSADRYLLLDAKNHLVGPLTRDVIETEDGRARSGRHSYTAHPLRSELERTLRFLELEPQPLIDRFPPTATPFVMDRRSAIATTETVARLGGGAFADVFVREGLLEFFSYAGVLHRTQSWSTIYADDPITSVTVWPRMASESGLAEAFDDLSASHAPFFSIHRTALARLPRSARGVVRDFWVDRGLFASPRAAAAFIRSYRRSYFVGMGRRLIRERAAKVGSRG